MFINYKIQEYGTIGNGEETELKEKQDFIKLGRCEHAAPCNPGYHVQQDQTLDVNTTDKNSAQTEHAQTTQTNNANANMSTNSNTVFNYICNVL